MAKGGTQKKDDARKREEEERWRIYRSIPQKHIREMTGRQTKQLNEQAQRYGLPIGGPAVDLTRLLPALMDFLAVHGRKIRRDEEPKADDSAKAALEAEWKRERIAAVRLGRLEKERELIPREEMREFHIEVASVLSSAGDMLARQFGAEAQQILNDVLTELESKVDRFFQAPEDAGNGEG